MKTRARLATAACVLGLLAVTGGCMDHGSYTTEHINMAKEKMTKMKSALEWQTANGAFLSGDMDKALKAIDRSLALNEPIPRSHVLRARILMETGDLEGGLVALSRAETLEHDNVDAQYYLGIANERLERREEALKRFKRAAELDGSSAQYPVAAAEVLMDLGRLDEARVYLETRGAQLDNNAGVRQVLGHIAVLQGDVKRAATLFREAKLLAPNDTSVQEDLGRAQANIGDWADAEYTLSKLLALPEMEGRRDLKKLRARCLVETARLVDARELLIKLTNEDEGHSDVEAWTDLGNVSFMLNDMGRARVAYTTLLAIAPKRPEGHMLKAMWLRKRGDLSAASEAATAAVACGKTADSQLLLAMIQQELNDPDAARRTLTALVNSDPGNATARRLLASMSPTAVVPETSER